MHLITLNVDDGATDRELEAIDAAIEALKAIRSVNVASWGYDERGNESEPAPIELIVDRSDPDLPHVTTRLFIGGTEVHPTEFHIDPGAGWTRREWEENRNHQVASASCPEVAEAVAAAFLGVRDAHIQDSE